MDLPQYFLADLPDRSVLTAAMISDACLAVKANRRRYLQERTTTDLIEVVAALAEDWLDPENPYRHLALRLGPPGQLGFSGPTLATGLDEFFG